VVADTRGALILQEAGYGWALANAGQAEEAVKNLERALAIMPGEHNILDSLGFAQAALGQYNAAVDNYRRALAGIPDDGEFHLHLAQALQALGQIEEARREFSEAYRLRPDLKPSDDERNEAVHLES
jgi:Flp pilus assembly protein TadD